MTPDARLQLRKDVMLAEGFRSKPYRDTVNVLTIGFGRNLDHVGISKLEAEVLLDHDLAAAEMQCKDAFPWFMALNDARQRAVVEMVFNLGLAGFSGFKRTIAAIVSHRYTDAASHLLESKWAGQVGARAHRIAETMRRGY